MAKRKYIKENNLVKAINTDSLELQKPLVNEYYDINVHNSNMDKIDAGYKQNKNDILNINNELSKTENTKYTTTNGVKEFSCKDGYVDNVAIEGETLVNLFKSNGTWYNDTSYSYTPCLYSNIPANKTLTVINTSNKKIKYEIYYESSKYESCYIEGNSKILITSPSVHLRSSLVIQVKDGWSMNDTDYKIAETNLIVLEGDHTDKPISYFEGLKSVGQGDNIEVLTKNSDETKQDKKQISATLRSLPNGVKDTIEKRGNKYVKVQRCGELVLKGNFSAAGTGVSNQVLTRGQNYELPNLKKDLDSPIYCDYFKSEHRDNEALDEEHIINLGNGYFRIRVTKTKLSEDSVNGHIEYLNSINPTLVYELATPQIIELPNFNPQTYSDNTTLLINTGAIQGECNFEVTNSMGSEIDVLKDKVSGLDDEIYSLENEVSTNISKNTDLINNYKNRLNDGEIYNQNLEYIIQNYKSGHYYVGNCTGFPYGWGGLQIIRYNGGLNGCLVYHNLEPSVSTSGTYVNYFKGGVLKGWQKIGTTSTYSLLEEQVASLETQSLENENKILALQEENKELKEELTQIQASIASLTSLIAVTLEEK